MVIALFKYVYIFLFLGIGKEIDEVAKRRNTPDTCLWRKSVVNHLHWSTSTSSSGIEAVAKWTSMNILNHIQNVHTHKIAMFSCCQHKPLAEARPWLIPDTAAFEPLGAILLHPHFLKDVEKISPRYDTLSLEAFHSLMNRFFPKSVGFSLKETLARLQIAALHFNENTTQSHTTSSADELKYSIVYPKNKGGDCAVRFRKIKPTSFYIDKLMALLFEKVMADALPHREYSDKVLGPEPPCVEDELCHKQETFLKSA